MNFDRPIREIKLRITTADGSQTFNNINTKATVDQMYSFLDAIGNTKASEYSKLSYIATREIVQITEE